METLGQKLRSARERKRMNLSRAAALTRIKVQHLEMIENDDFSKMPAPTYAKGFIRIYAGFLGLDPAPLVQEYVDRHQNADVEARRPSAPPAPARKAAAPVVDDEGEETVPAPRGGRDWSDRLRAVSAAIGEWGGKLLPMLPRLAVLLVVVLMITGMVRCAARWSAATDAPADAPLQLDGQAIMKEPPVRYLELPATEENAP